MLSATAFAGDCLIGDHELGVPVADLKKLGHYERGSPTSLKIRDATTYRCLYLSGNLSGVTEYVAIRDGVLVAVVREYLHNHGSQAVAALDERYGKGRGGNLNSVLGLKWTPKGKLSEGMSTSESWEDPTCGLLIQYVEVASSILHGNYFELATSYTETRRSIIWRKGGLPKLDDAGSAAPAQAQSVEIDRRLPEVPSPAVIEIEASALRSLRPGTWNTLPLTPRFQIDGAVLKWVEARLHPLSSPVQLDFRFNVRLRRGADRNAGIDYELVDRGRALGSESIARRNLDEGEVTEFTGSLKIARTDFDALENPVLRVTLSAEEPF
jgi:hypothetical protein